jgi:hypothetical protein
MKAASVTLPVALAFLGLVGCSSDQAPPTAPDLKNAAAPSANARIVPPVASPGGKSYGEWAAEWWKWALGTPASVNPLLDPTGEHCGAGQPDHVWFLAGSFGGSVNRQCAVPTGRPLFFPVVNAGFFAFLNDPPATRTEEFVRAQVACIEDAVITLVEIDGTPVQNPKQYLEKSPLFTVVLPEDNIFGATPDVIPELTLSPSADEGFYLYLTPRQPGEHTIRWQASSAACGTAQDVTYHLTVK